MELTLRRESPTGPAIHGRLTIQDNVVVQALERLGVQIQVGRYEVVLFRSPHFRRNVPLLVDVPGRAAIEIHGGNLPSESDGCILVGITRTDSGICNCDAALKMIVRLIELARDRKEKTYITVIEAKV